MADTPQFVIKRKNSARGEDAYKYFSVRMKAATVEALDALALDSKHSRNELIQMMCDFCTQNGVIEDE